MGVPGAAASGEGPACSWCGVPSVAWRLTRGGRSSNVGWWSDAERVRSVPDATSATASGRAPRPADALTAPSRGSVRDQPYGPESPVLRLARAAGTAAPFPSCGVLGRGRRAGGGPPSPRPTPFQDRAGVSQENRARCQRSESRLSASPQTACAPSEEPRGTARGLLLATFIPGEARVWAVARPVPGSHRTRRGDRSREGQDVRWILAAQPSLGATKPPSCGGFV